MANSIFPSVTVTQVVPLNAGRKPLPAMTVGLVGPMFTRISETKINGYAIEPATAASIAVNLTGITDTQYIDYDSVEAQLVVNSTDNVVTLSNADEDVIEAYSTVKSGIEMDTSVYGFCKAVGLGGDHILYPSTGSSTVFGAVPGDWVYRLIGTGNEYFQEIKQVVPGRVSKVNFPAPTSFLTDTYTWQDTDDITDIDDNDLVQHQWLIATLKTDTSVMVQMHIASADCTSPGITVTLDDDITSDTLVADADIGNYDWSVYDMPFGSLRLWPVDSVPSAETTTATSKYSVLSFPLRISESGGAVQEFGRMFKEASAGLRYIFTPDKRFSASYGTAKAGDYLRATNRTTSTTYYDFRITQVGSQVLKATLNAPDSFLTDTYTFPSGTTFTDNTDYVDDKSYLVAVLKTDATKYFAYRITDITGLDVEVTNIELSTDGAGANNGFIATGDISDYNWYIYDMPPTSLLLSPSSDTEFLAAAGENSVGFDFSIINIADYYVSGEKEVTILNHLADDDGDEIGLADVIFTYNALETAYSNVLYDVRNQTDRDTYCGIAGSYNPLGLASGCVEVNTPLAYKVVPTNIALSERDPSNPMAYTGKYVVGGDNPNYHDVTVLDWTGAQDVFDSVTDTQIPYYVVPLTTDASTLGSYATSMATWAAPDTAKEMVTFVSTSLPSSTTVLSDIIGLAADFEIDGDNNLKWKPTTKYVSVTQPSVDVNYLSIGAKKNDYMTFIDSVSGDEVQIQILNTYASYFDLGTSDYADVATLITAIDSAERITIKRLFANKADSAAGLVKVAEGYASPRVKVLWGDAVDLTLGGVEFTNLPMYYGAAAYAGMANGIGTVSPKTKRTINGISRVYNVTPYFSMDDLEVIGSGYVDILTQDFDGGPVYSMRQFMSDGSELSGVEPVDEFAKYLRGVFRPILGKHNITNALFDVLSLTLSGAMDLYSGAKFESITIVEGFQVTGVRKDRVSLKLRPVTYKPFNGLDIELQIA